MGEIEKGGRWWVRYVVVPLVVGSGGLGVILLALLSGRGPKPAPSPPPSRAPKLEIADVIVRDVPNDPGLVELDFRLVNTGNGIVTVNRVGLEIVEFHQESVLAMLDITGEYAIDMTGNREGDWEWVDVAHHLEGDAADRFVIRMGGLNPGRWTVRPTLMTSHGDLVGPKRAVSLP